MAWVKRWDSSMVYGITMIIAVVPFMYFTSINSEMRLIPFGFIIGIGFGYIFELLNKKYVFESGGEE